MLYRRWLGRPLARGPQLKFTTIKKVKKQKKVKKGKKRKFTLRGKRRREQTPPPPHPLPTLLFSLEGKPISKVKKEK
jgi:hypothetical protein